MQYQKPEKLKRPVKAPRQQLATKAAHKGGGGGNGRNGGPKIRKPHINYAIIVMREIRCYQKSVNLLIPLLLFYIICYILTFHILFTIWQEPHVYTSCIINALPEIVYKGCDADNSLEGN